jgi:hypothetical protein
VARSGDVYQQFVRVSGQVANTALGRKSFPPALREQLRSLIHEVINGLGSADAVTAVENAWDELDPRVADLLERELRFIAELHEGGENPSGSDDVATGKESLEDILEKLPKWLKHLLKILNEILKLVRPT